MRRLVLLLLLPPTRSFVSASSLAASLPLPCAKTLSLLNRRALTLPRLSATSDAISEKVTLVSAAPPPASPPLTLKQWAKVESAAIAPTLILYALYTALKNALGHMGITFPASIVGMLTGFGVLCTIRKWRIQWADNIANFFAPASRIFRAWLAAIFAPGLIALPLVMPALPARQLVTFVGVLTIGYVASLLTGIGVAKALAPRAGQASNGASGGNFAGRVVPARPAASPQAYVPFPRSQQRFLLLTALLCAGVHVMSGSILVLNLGLLATTLGTFSLASTLTPPAVQVYAHPFLQCSAATLLASAAIGGLTGAGWRTVLGSYASAGGAGGWLSQLLGPVVVSFALQLYAYRQPLMKRSAQIIGTAFLGTFFSMLTSAAAARVSGIAPVLRLALFSRTTTTALTAELSRMLSTPPAIGLLAAFITAILALATGKPLMARLGVHDPVTRGLAMSSVAHGGAVVIMSDEPDAFPFSVLMMNLGAAAAVVLLSLKPVRALLLAVAGL